MQLVDENLEKLLVATLVVEVVEEREARLHLQLLVQFQMEHSLQLVPETGLRVPE